MRYNNYLNNLLFNAKSIYQIQVIFLIAFIKKQDKRINTIMIITKTKIYFYIFFLYII